MMSAVSNDDVSLQPLALYITIVCLYIKDLILKLYFSIKKQQQKKQQKTKANHGIIYTIT
jgi:preprotein translocase subunit YajC